MDNLDKTYKLTEEYLQGFLELPKADFMFKADDYLTKLILGKEIRNYNYKLIIECDGYEFHQKTRQQVQKDNEREYDLKMAGYEILRFSGSQIYNEPLKCAEDTYNYIMKKIKEG